MSQITDNTKQKLKEILADIREDCEGDFTGTYSLSFNDGGLSSVLRVERDNYTD